MFFAVMLLIRHDGGPWGPSFAARSSGSAPSTVKLSLTDSERGPDNRVQASAGRFLKRRLGSVSDVSRRQA